MDYNRNNNNYNPFPQNRGEGSGMESQLQQNYQNQTEMTAEQQYIGSLASDPQMAAAMAQQLRERLAGQQSQQNQAPVNPHQAVEDDVARLQNELNAEMAKPDDQRDYPNAQRLSIELQSRRQDLLQARQEYGDRQRAQSERVNEARNVYIQFTTALIGGLPDDFVASMNTTKPQIGEEFRSYVLNQHSTTELANPGFLNKQLPILWRAFAFDKQLPAPGQQPNRNYQGQQNQYQPPQNQPPQNQYQQNQYQQNQGQTQYGQTGNEADPLANVFTSETDPQGMQDNERAMMKAYYAEKGQYDLANRISYRDGSPIPDRREM